MLIITGCVPKLESDKISVVSTVFPGYDFSRAAGKDKIDLTMLIKPGGEVHSYDPSPKDIIKIRESDLFIYVGGESESWVENILKTLNENTKVIRLMDLVEVKEEIIKEGMEDENNHEYEDEHNHEHEHGEYDEHVWTSPKNAIKIVEEIKQKLIVIDEENKDNYIQFADEYISELKKIDNEIKDIVNNAVRKEIVFADRFPFRYFADEYNLDYRAAFPGCSSDTEASFKTITYLVDYVKFNKIPVVFYLELSSQNLANTLVEETGAKKLEFQSAHNLTKNDFENNITYIDIMKRNIKNLKEALN